MTPGARSRPRVGGEVGRIGGKVHRGRLAGGCGNRRACVVGSDRQMAVCRGLRRGVRGGSGIGGGEARGGQRSGSGGDGEQEWEASAATAGEARAPREGGGGFERGQTHGGGRRMRGKLGPDACAENRRTAARRASRSGGGRGAQRRRTGGRCSGGPMLQGRRSGGTALPGQRDAGGWSARGRRLERAAWKRRAGAEEPSGGVGREVRREADRGSIGGSRSRGMMIQRPRCDAGRLKGRQTHGRGKLTSFFLCSSR